MAIGGVSDPGAKAPARADRCRCQFPADPRAGRGFCPDMGRKHRGRRAAVGRHLIRQGGCGLFHDAARLRRHQRQIGIVIKAQPAFEHRHVMTGIFSGKGQIGTARRLKRLQRRRLAAIEGKFHQGRENLISLPRGLGDQILAPGEMAIDGGGRHLGRLRRLRQGEALRPLLGDQVKRCLDQRLPQIAVMIAAFRHPRVRDRRRWPDRECRSVPHPCPRNRPVAARSGWPQSAPVSCHPTGSRSRAHGWCDCATGFLR